MAASKRTSRHKKSASHHEASDKLALSALKLIDEAAGALKKGVRASAQQSAAARRVFRKKALSLVGTASIRLAEALEKGAASVRQGIRKL